MYIPAPFRETRLEVLHAFMRENSFATLVSQLNGEIIATHLPILLDAEQGPNGTLVGHMARPNPQWQAFESESESLVIFQGPHAYISPSWYVSQQAVPTWNYTAVHAYGRARIIDDARRIRELLDRTVGTYEAGFAEPWSTARVTDEYVTSMARGIVAFEMPIARLEGKRKLSQNRPVADAEGAIAALRAQADPLGAAVADLMSDVVRERRHEDADPSLRSG